MSLIREGPSLLKISGTSLLKLSSLSPILDKFREGVFIKSPPSLLYTSTPLGLDKPKTGEVKIGYTVVTITMSKVLLDKSVVLLKIRVGLIGEGPTTKVGK